MKPVFNTLLAAVCLAVLATAAGKKLQMSDLPSAVQKTVQSELKGAEIKSISKETENGKVQYEVETMLNGKHRDFNVDAAGPLLVVEEETAIDSIPAAAKAAIEKKAAGGKLGMVEIMTKDGATFYEAAYTSKSGKKLEVLVKPDGVETKQ
jgi:uncharacterized membrane protein YkoI